MDTDREFTLSGSKSQQLRKVVEQLRREGKVVLVVKPGQPVSVLDSDYVVYDEPAKYWEHDSG
jgi:hypothetical protein